MDRQFHCCCLFFKEAEKGQRSGSTIRRLYALLGVGVLDHCNHCGAVRILFVPAAATSPSKREKKFHPPGGEGCRSVPGHCGITRRGCAASRGELDPAKVHGWRTAHA